MSMNDPIADLLTRIRNGQSAGKPEVSVQSSRVKQAILRVLKDEGYITEARVTPQGAKAELEITLKYYQGKPVIERLERVSRSGLRKYRGKDALPRILGGLGVSIISTSKGIMTDSRARAEGVGGEVICLVA